MLRPILVSLDGSPEAEQALAYAQALIETALPVAEMLRRRLGVPVRLVTAGEPRPATVGKAERNPAVLAAR